MSSIQVLDDNTINKIAAGEVVERPASVIKELVENSMDAGATRIEVEILAGGIGCMRVTDNGKGMSMEDARLAIQRHATSKIRKVDDLSAIGTLGFRGEALPTIAAVSRFSLRTRQEGSELGTQVQITGGKEIDIRETGCNIGTIVQAEDLFFNTPARKKFLKTNHTEAGKINDFLIKLALSRPEITFRFLNNGKTAIETPGNGNLYDTIQSIYGISTAQSLLGISLENEDISISGYLTKPSMLKSSRAWQTLIVNGRIIQNRAIFKAIDNAYKSMVPKSGFPLAVLNIKVPQNTIDVNVHPQKSEMKFENESHVFQAVYKAVIDAVRPVNQSLQQVAAVVQKPERHYSMEPMQFVPAEAPLEEPAVVKPRSYGSMSVGGRETVFDAVSARSDVSEFDFPHTKEKCPSVQEEWDFVQGEGNSLTGKAFTVQEEPANAVKKKESLSLEGELLPMGQVDLCYIVARDLKGLYIIDQHAAHERILYDRFSEQAEGIPSQQLLMHLILCFDSKEAELIEKNQELFCHLGFSMEACGSMEFRLMEVPADIPVGEAEEVIREILVNLAEMHAVSAKEIRHQVLATTACRAAIKAGEELNLRQMQIILEELSHTAYPYTCPHGRPTILRFSSEELAKMFKRTGF